jgi:dimethylargininase
MEEIMLTSVFTHAITRIPGKDFAGGITTANLGPPGYERILDQHRRYVESLRSLGLQVEVLEPLPGYPDAYFVEDVAVVAPSVAVITRPGAPSRLGEADFIVPALSRHRPVVRIQPPGTLEGGDVLQVEKHFFIGISERTNQEGAGQLGRILEGYGYTWSTVPVGEGLHLKSGLSYLGQNTLLASKPFADLELFSGLKKFVLEPGEEAAANTLLVNGCLLTPTGFPQTRRQLDSLGLPVIELEVSEVQKMDGGLTCLSLRF